MQAGLNSNVFKTGACAPHAPAMQAGVKGIVLPLSYQGTPRTCCAGWHLQWPPQGARRHAALGWSSQGGAAQARTAVACAQARPARVHHEALMCARLQMCACVCVHG